MIDCKITTLDKIFYTANLDFVPSKLQLKLFFSNRLKDLSWMVSLSVRTNSHGIVVLTEDQSGHRLKRPI